MNNSSRIVESNLLFCVNIFIGYLILFENYLYLPKWLQLVGRMHPLFLHFPIVLLLLAMGFEFFSFKSIYKSQPLYERITYYLMFSGALSASITVIMGLFLSKEDGYDSDILVWHKWSGILIAGLASLIYWIRNHHRLYKPSQARVIILITTFCIFAAGHFGGSLTHGENYVLTPVTPNKTVSVNFNDALVYDNLIKPLFEAKCQSCHNDEKNKGKLKLLDSASIIKGGKSGKLFVAGSPEISLLLERIHLSEEDKKHMPPIGKPQLSESEMKLLYWWIRRGAQFEKRLIELPVSDSLRIIAAEFINGNKNKDETFAFSAADSKLVQSLNNNNRTVYSLSKRSPALAVDIFNSTAYSVKLIEELKPVKEQIISLEADRLPVNDDDLKLIRIFNNLRNLSLNFTEITSKGLKELINLKDLASLSISGTKLNYEELQTLLPAFKNLKKLSVWNAGLDTTELKQLRKQHPNIEWNTGFVDDGAHPLKLNQVILQNTSQVFSQLINARLSHPIKGVEIRYTTDGSVPDSIHSLVYNGNIELKTNTILKAQAFKKGWIKSEVAEFKFFRNIAKPDSIVLLNALHEKFPAMGDETFFDGQLGGGSPFGDKWAGIAVKPLNMKLKFNQPVSLESLSIQYLVNPILGGFPPEMVEIWGGVSEKDVHLLSNLKLAAPDKNVKTFIDMINCKFKSQRIGYLKLIVKPPNWPNWHENKGKNALLFIDEIFLN